LRELLGGATIRSVLELAPQPARRLPALGAFGRLGGSRGAGIVDFKEALQQGVGPGPAPHHGPRDDEGPQVAQDGRDVGHLRSGVGGVVSGSFHSRRPHVVHVGAETSPVYGVGG
jgi:hypothetical protein